MASQADPPAAPAAPGASGFLARHGTWLAVCLAYLTVFPYYERINNPNENARIWMTRAIVNYHQLNINRVSAEWGYVNDKAKSGTRIYSGKAPGTSLLGVPVLFVETKLAALLGHGPLTKRATTLALRLFTVALPLCLFLFFFARQLERRIADRSLRNLLLAGLGLGTMLFPYGVIYVGHAQAAALGFVAGALLFDDAPASPRARGLRLALAGAAAGFAVVFEYQVIFAAVVLTAYAIARHRRAVWAFFAGTIPAVLVLGAHHTAMFGRPWEFPFSHLENPEFARLHNQVRLFGLGLPVPRVLATVLFSPDLGLFIFSPFLLLGLLGAVAAVVRGPRLEGGTILLVFLAMLAFMGGVPNWHAGWCVGPRYIAVVVPFLAWGITHLCGAHPLIPRRLLHGLLAGLVIVSVVLCATSGALYPHYPEQFDNPLFDLAFPLLRDGYQPYSLGWLIGLRGAASLAPLAIAVLAALATGVAPDDPRPRRWLAQTALAVVVAIAFLLPLSAYGRKPRPAEAEATRVVRAAWEPPPAPARR